MTDPEYAKELGQRLRWMRRRRGLSLLDVQAMSDGRWTPGTLGAYERGNRTLRVHRLIELAELYDVPPTFLVPQRPNPAAPDGLPSVAIDLSRLRRLPPTRTGPLRRWITIVQGMRDDSARDLCRLRRTDLHGLARVYSTTPHQLYDRFEAWGTLAVPPQPPPRDRRRRGTDAPR